MISETIQNSSSIGVQLAPLSSSAGTSIRMFDYVIGAGWDVPDISASMKSLTPEQNEWLLQEALNQRELSTMKSRLSRLLSNEDEEAYEELGATIPTIYAFNRATALLEQTFRLMGKEFYRGAVTTSFEGGIRVEWTRQQGSIRLVIPRDKNGNEYIYYEIGNNYGADPVSAENLAAYLRQLIPAH